jgi:hypothetical protein
MICNPTLFLAPSVLLLLVLWLVLELTCLNQVRCRRQLADDEIHVITTEETADHFQALIAQWNYQDGLHWNCVGTLAAIQVATLAAAYSERANLLAFTAIITLGFTITLALYWLAERIKAVRDANEALITKVGRHLNPHWLLRPAPNPVTGDQILRFGLRSLLVVDLVLLWYLTFIR